MPTLQQVATYVNGKLDDLWTIAHTRQNTYADTHGRYWQGLITKQIPLLPNNNPAAPSTAEFPFEDDEVVGVAGSHDLGWKAALPGFPATIPAAFIANEWLSPTGIGWTLSVYVKWDNKIYTRSRTHEEDHSITTTQWEELQLS